MVISNGVCTCQSNYLLNNATGRCDLACAASQFVYQGRCAQCPLNLIYRPEINGCSCPNGMYLDNYGVCEIIILPPVTCSAGSYFDSVKGCVSCPAGCKTCSSATVCTSCSLNGYSVQNNVCAPLCGDGLIVGNETCDNKGIGQGCSSTCQIQPFYVCSGQPSVCIYNGPAVCGDGMIETGETCDDGNSRSGDGCSSTCKV
jgi:cysteine-rich repeat protein